MAKYLRNDGADVEAMWVPDSKGDAFAWLWLIGWLQSLSVACAPDPAEGKILVMTKRGMKAAYLKEFLIDAGDGTVKIMNRHVFRRQHMMIDS